MRRSEDYETLELLGEGASGKVFRARDRRTDELVAIKRGAPESLAREHAIASAVLHENVVRAFELAEDDAGAFLVMELVEGESLVDRVRADVVVEDPAQVRRNLPVAFGYKMQEEGRSAFYGCTPGGYRTLRILFAQLASALRATHAAGFVHLDVARENVLVESRLKLLDFGIARAIGAPLNTASDFVGNAVYLAPEIALGRAVAPECDWYSAGVLLFECLTGARPFDGGGGEVMVRKQSISAPDPADLVDDLPGDLRELCRGLLERDPRARRTL